MSDNDPNAVAPENNGAAIATALEKLRSDNSYRHQAEQMAQRYAGFNRREALGSYVDWLESRITG